MTNATLEENNRTLSEILKAKEKECRLLEAEVRNIESRWKSGANEAYRVTCKGILSALQLKSLNDLSDKKL